MKRTLIYIVCALLTIQCGQNHDDHNHAHDLEQEHNHQPHEKAGGGFELTINQVEYLKLNVGNIEQRELADPIQVNGTLEVPPQNKANVTALVPANVSKIHVIEGQQVEAGDVLVELTHPNLIDLQTDYQQAFQTEVFAAAQFERAGKLRKSEVNSGEDYIRAKMDYERARSAASGLHHKLELLGLNPTEVSAGKIVKHVPISTPFNGFVRMVHVNTGQYVLPEQVLVEVVNMEHMHADFMVFERDIHRIQEGQEVTFSTTATGEKEYSAAIYLIGKNFEQEPKAIHIHADLSGNAEGLLPGMYVSGVVQSIDSANWVLPEDAVVDIGGKAYAFEVEQHEGSWHFTPIAVKLGKEAMGFREITWAEQDLVGKELAMSQAYALLAEWKKEEAEHDH